MATHCIILAWRIPWTEEPGRLQSMGSQRLRHDLATEHTTSWQQPADTKHVCYPVKGTSAGPLCPGPSLQGHMFPSLVMAWNLQDPRAFWLNTPPPNITFFLIFTEYSILAWEIPWTEKPSRLHSPWGCKKVRYDLAIKTSMTSQLKQQQHNYSCFTMLG